MNIIIGAGAAAREAFHWACDAGIDIDAFAVDSPKISHLCDCPVMPIDDIPDHASYVVAIGDSQGRYQVVSRIRLNPTVRPFSIIHPRAFIAQTASIGGGAIIAPGVVISVNCSIDRHFRADYGALVGHDALIGECVTLSPGAIINGWVALLSQSFIGAGAMILNGSAIRRRIISPLAVVGMGAVVLHDVPGGGTWVGNPARKI